MVVSLMRLLICLYGCVVDVVIHVCEAVSLIMLFNCLFGWVVDVVINVFVWLCR